MSQEEMTENSKPDNYSTKTTTDIKAKAEELESKSGLSKKDFFATMVLNYEQTMKAGTDADQTEDMQQIRYHLGRADSLFLNLVQKLMDLKSDFTARMDEEGNLHKSIVDDLQKQKTQAISERDQAILDKTTADNTLKDIITKNAELEETHRLNRSTIDILTRKNEELESKIGTVAAMEEEVKAFQERSQNDARQLSEVARERDTLQQSVKSLEIQIEQLSKTHQQELEHLKEIHQLELDKCLLETEKRVLGAKDEARKEYVDLLKENRELSQTVANLKADLASLVSQSKS